MSTKPNKVNPANPVESPLSLRELGEVLVKHYDLHEGIYDVLIEFRLGVGPVGQPPDTLPGAMFGVAKIGLTSTQVPSPHAVDAAVVNPPKPGPKKAQRKDK